MDQKDEEDASHDFLSQKEEYMSGDDNSDNDSVDSAQLLADITDVLNSSDLDFSGKKKSESNITVSYLDRDHSAGKSSDKSKARHKVIHDDEVQKHERTNSIKELITSSHNDPHININSELKFVKSMPTERKKTPAEYVDLSCALENNRGAGLPVLKEPVVCLIRLDPNLLFPKSQPPQNLSGSAQSLPPRAELSSGDRKARKKTEIKKSVWYEEDSPLSDISVSDVSDAEDEVNEQKSIGIKDRISVTHDKNSKSNPSHHKVSEKNIVSVEKQVVGASPSSLKSKVVHSDQNSSLSQSKKSTSSGIKISNPTDRLKANDVSLKSTDKDRRVTEKSKTNSLVDSRKRRLSKEDRGTDMSSQSSHKHQRVASVAAKKSDDVKQGISLFTDKNPKLSSVETKKTVDVIQLSNWRYELHLSPVNIDDLSNESFRKFINLASDCAINFDLKPTSHHNDGRVNLYFGTAPQMQSGMQKLCQLSLIPPKILQGTIKCRHIKQTDNAESDVKWMSTEEVKLGFSMFSTWTEKVKQLVQGKDWKREDETKRKFAQIQRIPPIVSKEMISLLFPFSHNVHITRPNASDQKKDSSGHTSVEFENTAWLETMLSCFQDLYVAKTGSGNPVWKLRITNFTPQPEKIPEHPVTGNQSDVTKRNKHAPKTPAVSATKEKSKDFTTLKQSNRHQAKLSKEPSNSSGKDKGRKRSFPQSDVVTSGGGSEKKRRPSEGTSTVRSFDHSDGPSPQNAETDKSNLRVLAQSRGLDPNNVDVLRILEMQNQLTSLQALFSCSSTEDGGSQEVDESHAREKSHGRPKMNRERNNNLSTNSNTNITEAEKQLRENISNKQRQLRELEEKLHRKRSILKDNSEIQPDGSLAASRNNEPLDFTKPAPKIEEAVKKDEERSKMFASNPSTTSLFPYHSKGKRDNQKESAITAEDFALPLQFGKNVSKVAIDEITHQTDRQRHERKDNRHSANRSAANRSDQRKNLNDRHPLPKGPAKGSASNVSWNHQRERRNFDGGRPVEWTPQQGQFKERDVFDKDRIFQLKGNEGSSKSEGNLFQESSRLDQNRMYQNFGRSHNKGFGSKTNTSFRETDQGSYPVSGQRSHTAHEKMWQEKSNVETRHFPEGRIKSDLEMRRAQSERSAVPVRHVPENEYWDEFEDADYKLGDKSLHGNRQDNVHFFRENVQSDRYNPLRKSSDPLHTSYGNQLAAPRESPGRLYERQHQKEMAPEKCFGNAWMGEGRFEDVQELQHSGDSFYKTHEYVEGNTDFIPPFDRDEAFDQEFGFQMSMSGRGNSLRGRGVGVGGRGGMEMRGRGTEFQRGGVAGRGSTEPPIEAGMRGRGHEPQRGALARERASEVQRGGPAVGRGAEPPRGFGMRGQGHEPQRGAATGGRGSEFDRGGGLGEREVEPQRGFGMRGRGHEHQRGAATGGRGSEFDRGGGLGEREVEPQRGFGMRGRGQEPKRRAVVGGRGSEFERGGRLGRDAEPIRGFGVKGRGAAAVGRGSEPGKGGASGGRGGEHSRGLGIRGIDHEPQTVRPMDERDTIMESPLGLSSRGRGALLPRGRGTQSQRGLASRGRGVDPQRGIEMRKFEEEAEFAQNEGGRGPLFGTGIQGRGIEIPQNTERIETSFETQRGYGIGMRGRGILRIIGTVGRDEELQGSMEIQERGFEGVRGSKPKGRGVPGQRGRGMRGRGNEIQQGLDVNERNDDMREGATEIPQGGRGMRGKGGHPQRGGNGRGSDPQRGSMAGRGRGFQNPNSFSDVRGEHSSYKGFGRSEENFHADGSGGESIAPIPVIRSGVPRRTGQNVEWQQGQMSQGGSLHADVHLEDRFEDFVNSIPNQEHNVTDYARAGSSRGRESQSSQVGFDFEHRQNRMQEANSSISTGGSAGSDQRGRGVGFGTSPRGRGKPRGLGAFMGPPALSPSSHNLGGMQFHPQSGQESVGDFGGRGNFNVVGQNGRRPQGRGGQPPINISRRGGIGRNGAAWRK